MPLITVVTVVLNDCKNLEETMLSVIEQSYKKIEYIVIDGGSVDGTVEIIKKYEHLLDYWVSEPDSGIYDAMNKGIDHSNGEWISFMNSGDRYINRSVLADIFVKDNWKSVDVLYGNHEVIYPSGRKRSVRAKAISEIWKGSRFCHQTTFVRNNFKNWNFDKSFKVAADYNYFYNSFLSGKKFMYLDRCIASVRSGGFSDVERLSTVLEWWIIVNKSPKVNIYYCLLVIFQIARSCFKR
jgi:glycosyltransferase involved in cell wall biosynthesis